MAVTLAAPVAPVAPVAHAQSAATLIGGGLTALPTVTLGPNRITNSGFESGSAAPWSGGSGWTMDQLNKHSGTFSYRRDTGAPTASTKLNLEPGIYKFSAWVKTQNIGASMRLQFDFRPGTNLWFNLEIATGTADWKLYELKNMVVTQPSAVTLKLENFGNPAGTAWFDEVKLEEQLPQSVEAFLLYPNFRGMLFDDGPSTMKFDIKVTPPNNDFGRYTIRGQLKDEATGQVLATQSYPSSASFVANLEGGGMQPGRGYLATFSLIDGSSGAAVYTYPAYRVSRVPASARQSMTVSFDAKNRVLIKGQPRFILGVYDSGMGYSAQDSFWENALWSPTGDRRMDNMKINMYLNYWYGEAPVDAMNALMTNLQKRDVTYLQTGNCFDKFPAGSNFNINNSDAYVQQLAAHPGSAGFYTIDECVSTMIPGAFTQYERLRRLHPDSITFSANFGNPDLRLWRDATDIISTDPYPMFSSEPAAGYNHRTVADWTALSRNVVKDSRPIMTVLQFFKFTSLGRWPNLTDMRNHAYMAIVEGARGLWWWSLGDNALKAVCSGWCAEKTTYMNNLKTLVNEIAALEPALLADDAHGALTGNSNTNIKTKVKVVGGKGYVFAYNATNSSQTTSFTWRSATGSVTVHSENNSSLGGGAAFGDTFGPFAARVYVIANGGAGGGTAPPPVENPTVTFSAPSAGAPVSGTTAVTVAGSGGSRTGYTYTLTADGGTITGSGPSFSWNTTTATNGTRTLTATVRDSAGRTGSATRSVSVSNGGGDTPARPTVTLTPANGATVNGTVPVSVSATGGNGTGFGTTYTYKLEIDGTTVSGAGPTYSWNTTNVANGTHTLKATATDPMGQSGTATSTVTVSNSTTTPPPAPGTLKLAVTQPKPTTTVSGTAWAVMWLEGSTSTSNTYSLTLGGRPMGSLTTASRGPVSVPYDTKQVSDGTHPLVASVRDAAGKVGSTSVSITTRNGITTPSTPAPEPVPPPPPPPPPPPATGTLKVAITQPTNAATVRGTAWTVMWVEGQAGTSNTFQLFANGRLVASQVTASRGPITLPWITTSGPNGAVTLEGRVKDATNQTGVTRVDVTVAN